MTAPTRKGRTLKFTPERIEQIKNLVERGMGREQIAEMIDVTVGSLQVTCSRLGISLRRYRPAKSFIDLPPRPRPLGAAPSGRQTSLSMTMRRGELTRTYELDLPDEILQRLALEATVSNRPLAEIIVQTLARGLNWKPPPDAQ